MSKEESKTKESKTKVVKPLKDFECFFDGKTYHFKKGVEIIVSKKLLQNLKTEKVIN